MLSNLIYTHAIRFSDRQCLELGLGLVPWDIVALIDVKDMDKFAPYFGQLNEGFRIHNWRKPAITLSFGSKHKYATKELSAPWEITEQFLLLKEKLKKKKGMNRQLKKQQMARLEKILEKPEQYEVLASSYYKYYSYPTIAYKFIDYSDPDKPLGKYVSKSTTLAITKKNIVFIDLEHLNNRKHLYSSKHIEKKLLSFEKAYDAGSIDYFVRLRK